ncbi:hypothetical protein HYFRA_00012315 [Hymenoscyphus fraxineus]|uniref:Uncharacterized protein n=1 Tax=Hymenoscyphus fraxineus TaxID=746836 RepID=A0A9N9KYN4_9HELO|nr:hypothetical protein HYFRA_00012315 [Hymenoscyphus fraxineus]
MNTPPDSRDHGGRDSPWYHNGNGGIEVSNRGVRSKSAVPTQRFSYSRDEWARSRSPLLQRASQSSLASDLERPANSRKRTPVFNDFHTAHSFVVARKRVSQVEVATSPEENSIPLETLNLNHNLESPHEAHEKSHLLGNLPTHPPPALVPFSRQNSHIASTYNHPRQLASELGKPTIQSSTYGSQSPGKLGNSVLAHIKNAFSFQSTRDDQSGEHSHWHKDASKRESPRAKNRTLSRQAIQSKHSKAEPDFATAMDGKNSSYYHSSLDAPHSDSIQHEGWNSRLPHFAAEGSSIPESSTVGNIYTHYMASEEAYEPSDDGESAFVYFGSRDDINRRASSHGFPSSPKNQHSKFHLLSSNANPKGPGDNSTLQRSPPNFSLPTPANQTLCAQHTVPVSSQKIRSGFLQGEARVPVIKQGSGALNYNIGSKGQAGHHTGPNLGTKPSKGKEKTSAYGGNGREILVSTANAHGNRLPEGVDLQKRLPLEKEVSRALRRASGYSVYSIGSNSTHPRERYEDVSSETPTYRAIKSLLRRNAEVAPPSDAESQNGNRPQDKPQGQPFFDRQVIPSNWVSTRQRTTVRVPINQVSLPDSPPDSPPEDFNTPFGHRQDFPEDDVNDWETVGESAVSRPLASDFLGGTVGRAGSSIANHSDDDILSLGSFSSTDRITQHPGNIHYSGDYRQRDLKKSQIPVFLPVFTEHKVNGYLADSTRIRPPPNAFYQSPPPLAKQHENPFQSPPPTVMPSAKLRQPANVTLFPPLAHSHAHREPDVSGMRLYRPMKHMTIAQQSSQDPGWMDDFGDPGPMITTQREHVLRATAPEYAAAWQDVIPYDNNHIDAEKSQTDGFVEMQTYGGKSDSKKQRTRKPFVNGGPGAFYRGLRTVSSSHQQTRSAKRTARRQTVKDLPTNALRRLSLLSGRRPVTPTNKITGDATERPANDFVYRSPLAPPRRNSWKALYTESQMERMRDAAKSDGFFGPHLSFPGGFRQSMKIAGSQKRLFEAPRLAVFSRHSSNQTGLIRQKRKLSTVVLCLSSLFPPMLLLFALGKLDGIVCWWTRGQCSTFARGHKRLANILMYIWGLVVVLGLVAFLVYWFVFSHPRGSA